MASKNDKIIEAKEKLAADVLEVAQDALDDIKAVMCEASVKDLIQIFNSAVKTHRDLASDILAFQDSESKQEKDLAKEYSGKVDELLKQINQSGNE